MIAHLWLLADQILCLNLTLPGTSGHKILQTRAALISALQDL